MIINIALENASEHLGVVFKEYTQKMSMCIQEAIKLLACVASSILYLLLINLKIVYCKNMEINTASNKISLLK